MTDTAYQFSGSQLADYVGKCQAAWAAARERELDQMQAVLDDMTERCRLAERRGWDAAMTYALMILKGKQKPSKTLDERC